MLFYLVINFKHATYVFTQSYNNDGLKPTTYFTNTLTYLLTHYFLVCSVSLNYKHHYKKLNCK